MLHRVNTYYFILYLFLTINYFIFKLMCLLKAASFWKTMLIVSHAKILYHIFIPTIYENFKSVSLLI